MADKTIVLDAGSGHTKIGWADSDIPQLIYASVVGRPLLRGNSKVDGLEIKEIMIGEEARRARAVLELNYPIESGIVQDWNDMKELWNYGFKTIGAKPKENKILLTEPVMSSKKSREKQLELAFEQYMFSGAQIQIQALLSAFSEGRLTATILDSGDSLSYVVPIVEGYILQNLIKKIPLAGRSISEYLTKLLFLRGYAFNSSADAETVREIKERFCFISEEFEVDKILADETVCYEEDYRLPDGTMISLGKERFEAPEVLFTPYKAGHDLDGLGELVFNSIRGADANNRAPLYKNILLCGGTTLIPGFRDRLIAEVKNSYKMFVNKNPKTDLSARIDVIAPPRRGFNVFIGGTTFSKILDGMDQWITKKEWDEQGFAHASKKICNNLQMSG